ncbi:MAG: NAD+ synthase [Pseudomonadota bacterium]
MGSVKGPGVAFSNQSVITGPPFVKIAIAQINPLVGDIPGNCRKALSFIESAKKEKVQWIIFPELTLVGYPPRDLLDYSRLFQENQKALEEVQKASKDLGVIIGALKKNPKQTGKEFFNSAFIFANGKPIFSYDKRLLPSYDVFEDERYFEKGNQSGVFEFNGEQFGVAICEDIWNKDGFVARSYDEDPLLDFKGKKIKGLFVLSASPFDLKKTALRQKLLSEIAKELKTPVVYCNQVAGNDELIFDGGSSVVNEQGEAALNLPLFEETCLVWTSTDSASQKFEPMSETECLYKALSFGIRDYVKKSHQKKICLGLSGGIDSSVAAVLAVEAIGRDNVLGVSLPTRFTSTASREDAKSLAHALGIRFQEMEIEPIFEAFEKTLAPLNPTGLTLENIQPRIRMTLLMALSNQEGSLLLNTSNKSEIATGYSTLYGDSAGALAPLGDLLKHQVRALAAHINRSGPVVPRRVIGRAPTAELRPNQKDEDNLPPYSILDLLVEACLSAKWGVDELGNKGFSPDSVELFSRLHRVSEYKRKQMPPVLRISPKAFGMGRRIPLAARNYCDK